MFYLYIRTNYWYKQWNILKVGIFGEDLKDGRNQTYKTSEPSEGYFVSIWEINEDEKDDFDSFLKDELECKRYINPIKPGGTEFYNNEDNKLEDFIEEILKSCIKYKKLNKDEIDNIERKTYNTKNNSIKLKDDNNVKSPKLSITSDTKSNSVAKTVNKNENENEYKYIIPKDKFNERVVNNLPITYFRDYDCWLKFITACNYLGFIDIAKEKSQKYFDKKHGDFESDFMKNWNGIYKGNYKVIEELYQVVNCDDLLLYRYKPTLKNIVKPDEYIHIEKLSNKLDIQQNIYNRECYVIKSDTGTGKSYLARKVINELNQQYDINFISIVSRVGLAQEQYKDLLKDKLFVKYYRDIIFKEGMNLVTTIDSLLKLERVKDWSKYFIFVDEINSLLKHLWLFHSLNNRSRIIELLIKILSECRGFYLADADISDEVFDFLNYVKCENMHFIENTYKHNNTIEVQEVDSMETIVDMIKQEKKFLLCCDTKSNAQAVYQKLKDKFPQCQVYTQEDKLEGDFSDIECLIISPKVIYGQDSNLDRNVYCIYEGSSIDSEAMKQQICRERKIKKVFIHFTSLKKQAHHRKYETLQDCILSKTQEQEQEKIIEKLFGVNGYCEELLDIYIDLYNKFEYHIDCLKSNLRLHLFRILKNHGFVVKTMDDVKRTNICPSKMKKLKAEHRELLYNYENEEVKEYIIKNLGAICYEDREYIESILHIFRNKHIPYIHNIKHYLKLFSKTKKQLGDKYKCLELDDAPEITEEDALEKYYKVSGKSAFNINKVNDDITTKFYFLDLFKNDLDYKINDETNEVMINENWSKPEMKELFKQVMSNIIGKKVSEKCEGYELTKDFYSMYSNIFPKLYYTKQKKGKKRGDKSTQKYYYKDKHTLLPIVSKMIEHDGYECDDSILTKAINNII